MLCSCVWEVWKATQTLKLKSVHERSLCGLLLNDNLCQLGLTHCEISEIHTGSLLVEAHVLQI